MALQRKTARSYEIDMCNGPLFSKLLIYALPLMLSGILQLLFNAADIVVVGRFAGSESLAAVGSTSALINLLINLFIGLSIGTNVLVARYFSAQQKRDLEETVHTSMVVAGIGGVILIAVGYFLSEPLLTLMGTPDNVLPLSVLYMKIYFVGMPAMLVYNFGSAVLRAVGDTRRPLYFLFTAGVANALMNLFFVIVCHMGVAGVALATTISQCISAVLVVRCLLFTDADYKLNLKKLRIVKHKLVSIVRIGLPAGMQGAVFSISNVLIQSSVNSFGSVTMAGNTAASNIEGFIYTAMNSFYQTALSFVSQNYGVKNYKRISRIMIYCEGMVFVVGAVLGAGALAFGPELLSIYNSEPEVIQYGLIRMWIICTTYYLCGMMDVFVGGLRGMGYSVPPMIVSISGACAFRVIWIYTIFAANRTLQTLYISYPVSWALTGAIHFICYLVIKRKLERKDGSGAGVAAGAAVAQNGPISWRKTPQKKKLHDFSRSGGFPGLVRKVFDKAR